MITPPEKLTKRNSNIELLRFVLMTCICIWHVFVHGMNYKKMGNGVMPDDADMVLMCVLVPAVNCFMLISGYFGIRFSFDKMLQFMLQAFFCFIIGTAVNYVVWDDFSLGRLKHIFPILTDQWWFLTIYFVIFMLSPVINKGIESISKRQFAFIIIVLLAMNSFGQYVLSLSSGYSFQSLLIIYLIGRYLRIYPLIMDRKRSILIWAVSTAALFVCLKLSILYHPKFAWHLLSYNNPLIIIQSVCVLHFVLSFPPKRPLIFIFAGAHCFAVYLITEIFGLNIYSLLAELFSGNFLFGLTVVVGVEVVIMFIDYLQSNVSRRIRERMAEFEVIKSLSTNLKA